jgi:hypothetical protein
MGKRKPTKEDLEARAQMLKRNEGLLRLATKAQAEVEARKKLAS